MAHRDQEQRAPYADSGLQAPRPAWRPRDGRREQGNSAGHRNNLPSQQRAANQPNAGAYETKPHGQQTSSIQSQDQASQWPLRDTNAQPIVTSTQRRPAPQRPPRPNQTPLIFNAPRPAPNKGPPAQAIPQYRPDFAPPAGPFLQPNPEAWHEDEYGSPTYPAPNLSRPLTGSSRASTSSNYSVPDFPVPQVPQQIPEPQVQSQLRRPPLGPPPSARRGPSSYYPQTSTPFVPPIVEETDSVYSQSTRAPHDSYASSNAIPIGIADYYLEGREDQEEAAINIESPFEEQFEEDDSALDHPQEASATPVRQASIGKRSKPTLTTIRSSDSVRPDSQTRPLSLKTFNSTDSPRNSNAEQAIENVPMVPLMPGLQARTIENERATRPPGPIPTRTDSSGVLGRDVPSISEPEKALRQKRSRELLVAAREQVRTRSPLVQPEADCNEVSIHSEKGAVATLGIEEKLDESAKKGSLSKRVGSRRPPRLNVDAVRDAEARGSLTSLPDLIRRATRLASNLDRGRTASRLGMDWFGDERREKRQSGNSLSDILASFPPPGLATPPGSRGSRAMAGWPSHLRHSALPSESDISEAPRKRRCCGMPLWLFLLLLLVLVLVIAAAIIIPIVLIVIPDQKNAGASSSATALSSCQKRLTCENGGTNIIGTGSSCSCLCINGYTGSHCTEQSTTGCTTTDIDGTSNATVGDAIPRLIEGAQTNFSVSLNGSTILNMFSSNNLSCASENALVTFNGLSARSVRLDFEPAAGTWQDNVNSTMSLQKRQATTSAAAAATSNGIVFDSTPTSTSTASSTSAVSTKSTSSFNSTMLDFARVAVLFVMEDSGQLNTGVEAQENLQDYFTSGTTSDGTTIDATNITLATGYTANLQEHTITTGS